MVRFLTSAFSLKLEDLADEWFISRATLQNDMAEVREHLQRYHLTLETRPRLALKLFGSEMAIRACLTDLLWTLAQQDPQHPLVTPTLECRDPEQLQPVLQDIFARFHIRLTDEGELFLRLYCAVAVRRISEGYPLPDFAAEEADQSVCLATREIAAMCTAWQTNRFPFPKTGYRCILLLAKYKRSRPVLSMRMMTKRWSITFCVLSTRRLLLQPVE